MEKVFITLLTMFILHKRLLLVVLQYTGYISVLVGQCRTLYFFRSMCSDLDVQYVISIIHYSVTQERFMWH